MKNNKLIVTLLILFIVAIFGWIGYTLFFPKSSSAATSNMYPRPINVERALAMRVPVDFVKSIKVKEDLFSPLVVKLDREDLVSLLKSTSFALTTAESNLRYLSGVKSKNVNMVTFSLNGKSLTLDFNRSETHFSWKGQNYVLVYFDPAYEGAVIMNVSNGRLYIVTSRGLITNEGGGQL